LLEGVKGKLSPQVCESDRFGYFVATMVKLQQLVINEPDKVRHRHGSYSASLSALFATSQFVLMAHYYVSITS